MKYALLSFLLIVLASAQEKVRHGFGSRSEVHDAEHIKQHLGSKIDVEALSENKQRFHYFKLHDLNKDGALDGLEIIKALTHSHTSEGSKPKDVLSDTELENLVDTVMKDMDLNLDGRIDFSEYLRKQQN